MGLWVITLSVVHCLERPDIYPTSAVPAASTENIWLHWFMEITF